MPMENNFGIPPAFSRGVVRGGNAPRRRENGRRPVLVFIQDVSGASSSSRAGPQEVAMPGMRIPNSHFFLQDTGPPPVLTPNDEWLLHHHIGDILKYPEPDAYTSFPEQQKHQAMESKLEKYKFYVATPGSKIVNPVSIKYKHGREYYIGHIENEARIKAWIERKWPLDSDLTEAQQQERCNAEWTLYRSQQAMRYLNNHPGGAIIHEPSGTVYLSPHAHSDTTLDEVFDKYNQGKFPKLRYKDDRLHFKMSESRKKLERSAFRRPTAAETSSEEDDVQGQFDFV